MLAIGRPIDDGNLRKLSEQAMKLWEACSDERNQTEKLVLLRAESLEKELARQNEISMPKKFPVTFEEMLRLWIGGRNKDYRIKIYREYVKETIWRGHVSAIKYPRNSQSTNQRFINAVMTSNEAEKLASPVTDGKVDSALKQLAEMPIDSEKLYRMTARDFLNWFAKYKADIRQKRALAGAVGRKKKRKKNGQTL
jgi:hypothetical protein